MSVYFIRAGESGPVKIGIADNPRARLMYLQTANSERLSLLRVIGGGRPEERWLHRRFASQALRGEWFTFSAEMLTVEMPTNAPEPVGIRSLADSPHWPLIDAWAAKRGIHIETRRQWRKRGSIPHRWRWEMFVDNVPREIFDNVPSKSDAA